MPSGQCPKTIDPPTFEFCFVADDEWIDPPLMGDGKGKCFKSGTQCSLTASPCQFRGFEVDLKMAACVLGDECCESGTVWVDGAEYGSISLGGAVNDIVIDVATLTCSDSVSEQTKKIQVMCGVDEQVVVFEVTYTFRCNPCSAPPL
jgi:hypothetical protein